MKTLNSNKSAKHYIGIHFIGLAYHFKIGIKGAKAHYDCISIIILCESKSSFTFVSTHNCKIMYTVIFSCLNLNFTDAPNIGAVQVNIIDTLSLLFVCVTYKRSQSIPVSLCWLATRMARNVREKNNYSRRVGSKVGTIKKLRAGIGRETS